MNVVRNDNFAVFDYVDPASHIEQRPVTSVPSQSLFFLNNELVWKSSEKLGSDLADLSQDENQAIFMAFKRVLGREPSSGELDRSKNFLAQATEFWSIEIKPTDGIDPQSYNKMLRSKALGSLVHSLFSLREFIWVE